MGRLDSLRVRGWVMGARIDDESTVVGRRW